MKLEGRLPQHILDRASLRGNEYAWRVENIPQVIEAGRAAGLLNIGGQLQFRFPDGGTCECYWVEVDTYPAIPDGLTWDDRVAKAATVAFAEFSNLSARYDFVEEGRREFGTYFQEFETAGGNPVDAMYFVWYLSDAEEAARNDAATRSPGFKFR